MPSDKVLSIFQFKGDEESLRASLQEEWKKERTYYYELFIKGETPKELIRHRPGRGGSSLKYVTSYHFDRMANALFEHLWSFEIISQDIGKKQIWCHGRATVHVPGKTTITRYPDGRVVEERVDQVNLVRDQFGGCDIKFPKDGPKDMPIDIGDDLKSSASDSKKKCFSSFGFFRDIYEPRNDKEEAGGSGTDSISEAQLESLWSKAQDKHLLEDDLIGIAQKLGVKISKLGELTSDQAIDLMVEVNKRK
jgi:hypothetical protein